MQSRMNLAVGMQGPSLRATLPEISGYTAPDRPYRLSGRIQRAGDQALVFDVELLEIN